MLPYFRGMEAFSISLPKSWSDLSDKQLRFFFRQVARDLPMNEVLALCLCKWAKVTVICRADEHSTYVRHKRLKFQIPDWQITYATRKLAFLESFPPYPVRISHMGGAQAVDADLQGMTFEYYLACENYYQGFLHTKKYECLDDMAHLLYPELSDTYKLSKAELVSVLYWYAAIKTNFTQNFPHLFSSVTDSDQNLLGEPLEKQLRSVMNAQIRALTGGDITKENEVLQMNCWRALTELDAKAQEAQELRNQLK